MGDEGSGYGMARAGLIAALRAADGRGPMTQLLPELLADAGLTEPMQIPAWSGRAAKADVAALSRTVSRLASEEDEVALEIVKSQAGALIEHAAALLHRLGPWTPPVPVVLHGGLTQSPSFLSAVEASLGGLQPAVAVRAALADAVTGAVQLALRASP